MLIVSFVAGLVGEPYTPMELLGGICEDEMLTVNCHAGPGGVGPACIKARQQQQRQRDTLIQIIITTKTTMLHHGFEHAWGSAVGRRTAAVLGHSRPRKSSSVAGVSPPPRCSPCAAPPIQPCTVLHVAPCTTPIQQVPGVGQPVALQHTSRWKNGIADQGSETSLPGRPASE